jgi:effector-binding domain-containing protein
MAESPILYKKLGSRLIAFTKAHVGTRDGIYPLLDRLREVCGEVVCGDATVVFHGGAVKEGYLIEAAYPVTCPVRKDEVSTRELEGAPALTMLHLGSHQNIRETVLKVYDYMNQHAWTTSLFRREIYTILDLAQPERNVTEVQIILHEWDRLFAEGAEKALGVEACRQLMQGIESISIKSSLLDYSTWIQGAINRLDELTDDNGIKCQVVSHCAHIFPQERIDHLRAIYERAPFDVVLSEMYKDNFWYEKPVRRGNVLHMRKNPFNPEGYVNAVTPAERRKAYCHCPFVQPYLDEIPSRLSPTFCYCGAGWYRQLWEGILGQPVKIEHVETLLRGNDQCTLTITLPLELVGECSPEKG